MESILNFVSNILVYFVVAITTIIICLTPKFIDLFKWLIAYADGKIEHTSITKNSKSFFSLINSKVVKNNKIIYPLKHNNKNEKEELTEKEQIYKKIFNSEIIADKKYSKEYMKILDFINDFHNENVTYWISENSLGKCSTFGSNMNIILEYNQHYIILYWDETPMFRNVYIKDQDSNDFKLMCAGNIKIKYEHLLKLLKILIYNANITQLHDKLRPTFSLNETILIIIQFLKRKYPNIKFSEFTNTYEYPIYYIEDINSVIFGYRKVFFDIWGNPNFYSDWPLANFNKCSYSSLCKKYEKLIQKEQDEKDKLRHDEQLKKNKEERSSMTTL